MTVTGEHDAVEAPVEPCRLWSPFRVSSVGMNSTKQLHLGQGTGSTEVFLHPIMLCAWRSSEPFVQECMTSQGVQSLHFPVNAMLLSISLSAACLGSYVDFSAWVFEAFPAWILATSHPSHAAFCCLLAPSCAKCWVHRMPLMGEAPPPYLSHGRVRNNCIGRSGAVACRGFDEPIIKPFSPWGLGPPLWVCLEGYCWRLEWSVTRGHSGFSVDKARTSQPPDAWVAARVSCMDRLWESLPSGHLGCGLFSLFWGVACLAALWRGMQAERSFPRRVFGDCGGAWVTRPGMDLYWGPVLLSCILGLVPCAFIFDTLWSMDGVSQLEWLCCQVVTLQLGLLAWLTVGMVGMMLRALACPRFWIGRCILRLCPLKTGSSTLCFTVLRVQGRIFALALCRRRKRSPQRRCRPLGRGCTPFLGGLWKLLLWSFSADLSFACGATPWRMPFGCYLWVLGDLPMHAHAMARPEPPEELPVAAPVRPHDLHADGLATFVGSNAVAVPWVVAPTAERPAWLCTLPLENDADERGQDPSWLGVQVFTPNFRPQYLGLRVAKEAGLHAALDAIRDELHDVPPSLHGMVLPLRPQRHPGFLSVIRYPAIICHPQGLASVAVGIDLTHVGGHFFACVLPTTLSYEELEAYVRPHTWHVDAPLLFYVGVHRDPWRTGRAFSLRNAEVITVLSNPDAHFHRGIAPELFTPTAVWSPIRHLPRMAPFAGYCVICGEERFFLRPHYHYGVTMIEAIARMLRVDVSAITTCFFPSSDMAMHGNECLGIVVVKKLPNPLTDSQQAGRRDVFTHIDCRALGVRPHIVHSHFPALHLPSIAARLDLKVPPHFRLCAAGGRVSGEDVYVQGHSTLLLYVVDESDADSDLPGSDPGAGRPIPAMQSDRSRSRSRESSSAQQAVGEPSQAHQAQEHPPAPAPLPDSAARCEDTDRASTLSAVDASAVPLWSRDPTKFFPTCDLSSRGFLVESPTPPQPATLEPADIPLDVCWNVLQCKGPAAPTNAQQAAINTLVYHGETHLLPAPLHRLGDEPPGQAVTPVAVASEGEDDADEDVESYQAARLWRSSLRSAHLTMLLMSWMHLLSRLQPVVMRPSRGLWLRTLSRIRDGGVSLRFPLGRTGNLLCCWICVTLMGAALRVLCLHPLPRSRLCALPASPTTSRLKFFRLVLRIL